MPIGARLYVPAGPTVTQLPFGLWSVVEPAEFPTGLGSTKWENGVTYQPDLCDEAEVTFDPCPAPTPPEESLKVGPDCIPTIGADPFTVYSKYPCGPGAGSAQMEEARARTSAALTNGSQRAVERVFWTGEWDNPAVAEHYPHLASNAVVTDPEDPSANPCAAAVLQPAATVLQPGDVVDVVEALGLLEGAMGVCYGGTPTIHVPRRALAHLDSWGLLRANGGRLSTLGGSLVAAGAGYPGTGPDGSTPTYPYAWFYATGAIFGQRSGIRFTSSVVEAVDTAKNGLVLVAEQTYVIGWDCCLFAVLVDLGGRVTGAGGSANGSGS